MPLGSDVHDHLEYVIASLEMFETVTENLISYSFNVRATGFLLRSTIH